MQRTLFSERYDYLLVVGGIALVIWSFYGGLAAIGSGALVAVVANLQPLRRIGFSLNASAILAAATVLVLSPLLKVYDISGYCTAMFGPERQIMAAFQIAMPCFAIGDFYQNTGQPGGMGYVRDVGLPLAGMLISIVTTKRIRASEAADYPSDKVLRGIAIAFVVLCVLPPIIHVLFGNYIIERQKQTEQRAIKDLEKAEDALLNQ